LLCPYLCINRLNRLLRFGERLEDCSIEGRSVRGDESADDGSSSTRSEPSVRVPLSASLRRPSRNSPRSLLSSASIRADSVPYMHCMAGVIMPWLMVRLCLARKERRWRLKAFWISMSSAVMQASGPVRASGCGSDVLRTPQKPSGKPVSRLEGRVEEEEERGIEPMVSQLDQLCSRDLRGLGEQQSQGAGLSWSRS
jgi:hypothetical protein